MDTHDPINEAVWEIRACIVTDALKRTNNNLDKEILNVEQSVGHIVPETTWDLGVEEKNLQYVQISEFNIEVVGRFGGVTCLGNGERSNRTTLSNIVSPEKLKNVLSEIKISLPLGWTLTPALQEGEMWRAYQEARVVPATH